MSEIEKMKRYIERTHMGRAGNYCLGHREVLEMLDAATDVDGIFHVIGLAFNYGKAKGYRAAKAEGRAKV